MPTGFQNWWNQNFVEPSVGVYQGIPSRPSAPFKNSTGVITPPTLDNYSFLNNNFAAPASVGNNAFSPIGSSAVDNAIAGTTPTGYTPFTGSFGNTPATGIDTSTSFTPVNNSPSFDWGSLTDGFDWNTTSNVLNTGAGLFQAYTGYQNLNLAKDQFSFQKNAWQQDYNQRLDAYNRQVARQEGKDAALAGNTGG